MLDYLTPLLGSCWLANTAVPLSNSCAYNENVWPTLNSFPWVQPARASAPSRRTQTDWDSRTAHTERVWRCTGDGGGFAQNEGAERAGDAAQRSDALSQVADAVRLGYLRVESPETAHQPFGRGPFACPRAFSMCSALAHRPFMAHSLRVSTDSFHEPGSPLVALSWCTGRLPRVGESELRRPPPYRP